MNPALNPHTSHHRSCAPYGPPNGQSAAALAKSSSRLLAAAGRDSDLIADHHSRTLTAKQPAQGYPLLVIVGPTAAGKSALAIRVAERLHGEIINCDSVQVYRGLEIGSAKVAAQDRLRVPHHLLDLLEPGQVFTAGHYCRLALEAIAEVKGRAHLPILAGGAGLYLRALLQGLFDGPARSERLRARLREMGKRRGRRFLHRLLARLDGAAAARIHAHDLQKIIRALEVCALTGQPISVLHGLGRKGLAGFQIFKIGLNPSRAELYHRIDQRVKSMFSAGLLDEVRAVLARYGDQLADQPGPLAALGYRQACAALRGEMGLSEAIGQTQAATRRYAKRQLTWFRRETDVTWFQGFGDDPEIQLQVFGHLRGALAEGSDSRLSTGRRGSPS